MGVCTSTHHKTRIHKSSYSTTHKRTFTSNTTTCKKTKTYDSSTSTKHSSSLSFPSLENDYKHKDNEHLYTCSKYFIKENNEMPINKYRIISKIGEGSFGNVYYSKNIATNQTVAIKKIHKAEYNKIDNLDIDNEITILKKLSHPNIIKIYEYYSTGNSFYIINEYCEHGELFKKIQMDFNENQIAFMAYQIISAVLYLHEKGIMHRDIKLENILINHIEVNPCTNKEYYWLKLIDFGGSKMINKEQRETNMVGTTYYVAPEVLGKNYNYKCDCWSIGVILYMLVTGVAPFEGKNKDELINAIKKGSYNKTNRLLISKSKELQDLISQLLEIDVSTRLSAEEALSHPFFKKIIPFPFQLSQSLNNNSSIIDSFFRNLLSFKCKNKFIEMVLCFLSHNISIKEQEIEMSKMFFHLNCKGNGKITKSEFEEGMKHYMNVNENITSYINELFEYLNDNNNEYMEYEQFMMGWLKKEIVLNDDYLKYAFVFFDRNNKGIITNEDLIYAFNTYTKCVGKKRNDVNKEEIVINIMKEIDEENKGNIDYTKFKQIMSNYFQVFQIL